MASPRTHNNLAGLANQGQLASVSSHRVRSVTPRAGSPNRAWHDLIDMPWLPRSALKKGLAARMDTMGNEILQQVRSEVSGAIQDCFLEFMTQLDVRKAKSGQQLEEFSKKLDTVQETSAQARDGAANIDLSKLIEANAVLHAAAAKNMEDQLSKVQDQLNKIQLKAANDAEVSKVEQANLMNMSERMQLAEGHLQRLCDSLGLQAATSDAAQDVQRMSQQLVSQQQDMGSKLDHVSRNLATKQDVRSMLDQVRRTENALNVDFQLILAEVSKLQKHLHMEFVQATDISHSGQHRVSEDLQISHSGQHRASEDLQHNAETIQERSPAGFAPETNGSSRRSEVEPLALTDVGRQWRGSAFDINKGVGLKVKKRVREYWTQTDFVEHAHVGNQTEAKYCGENKPKPKVAKPKKPEPPSKAKPVFADAEAMKAKARMALVKPQYNVFDHYHTSGMAQKIAKHPVFENVTLAVVCANAVWMAVDTDHNDAVLIQDMHPVFICGEMMFCTYFTAEVMVRFAAFAHKRRCLRDSWFVFDAFLVTLMILETWLLPVLVLLIPDLGAALENLNLGTLRLIRMVKILRLSRMAKLLRLFPELKIIVKGIRFAFRSVGVFFLLWLMIIFVTSILLTQLNSSFKTTDGFAELFARVDISMETLLLHGVLPHQASLLRTAMEASPLFWIILLAFVLLASMTIMYMLVGVLVEVMSAVAASEKEGMTVSFVATQLRETMEALNRSPDQSWSQAEFEKFLMEPEVVRVILGVGVDIGTLFDMMDIIFEDLDKKGISGLSFESMVDLLLNLRGANTATVKDVKELLRVLKAIISENVSTMQRKIQDEFYHIRSDLGALREETHDWRDEDAYNDESIEFP